MAIAFLQKRRKFLARKCAVNFPACGLRIGAQIAFKRHTAVAHLISRDRQYGKKSLLKIGQHFRADERSRRKNVRGGSSLSRAVQVADHDEQKRQKKPD